MNWIDFFIGSELVATLHFASPDIAELKIKADLNLKNYKQTCCMVYTQRGQCVRIDY